MNPNRSLFSAFLVFLVQLSFGQSFTSSDLPILSINTDGKTIVDDPKILATLTVIDNGSGKRNVLTDKPTFTSTIGIELRGSTSQDFFPKKPYGFELREKDGITNLNASLLGMPEESDWILNATYNDKTLLRDAMTFDLNRRMSKYYTPRTRYCELVINGTYQGVYILFEKIKRDKNRIDIADLKKIDVSGDQLTGGYILKVDKFEGTIGNSWESSGANSIKKKSTIQIDRPKKEDLASEQYAYIRKYFADFETALNGPNYRDPVTGYARFIDDQSVVDYVILTEVCRNVDGYRLSAFMYKDKDSKNGKLTFGPIWDYNLTYGNADYCDGQKYEGWAYNFNKICPADFFSMPYWWEKFMEDPTIRAKVGQRYLALRKTVLATDRIHAYIDSSATRLAEARVRNFQRWPVMGVKVWPNYYVGQTYDQEINWLKEWIRQRLIWLDGSMQLLSFGALANENPPDNTLSFSVGPVPMAETATVRYRLDNRADVQLSLTDLTGKSVFTIDRPGQSAGEHEFVLNNNQLPTSSGLYLLTLQTNGQVRATRKLVKQ